MKRDLAVGATSGYTFAQLRCWLNSLRRAGFSGDCVIIMGNHDAALEAALRAHGCLVVPRLALIGSSPGDEPYQDRDMCVDRYFLLWKYLSTLDSSHVRFVISVDMRDAVFQTDPSKWLEQHLDSKDIAVASEGLTYGDEPWNRRSMLEAFGPSVFEFMRDRLVWNCGTIAGRIDAVRDLSWNIYQCSRSVTYADQSALNMLLALWPFRERTLFDDGRYGWACQANTMAAAARGPELSYRFRDREPLFDGDTVYTADGTRYCIVHQYDRIPYWKHNLEKKFG